MPLITRPALLDDTEAISRLHRESVAVWQRLDAQGRVETVEYAALSLYERWTHGGVWMSVETGAVHLARLLRGVALPLLALDAASGALLGYLEAYPGLEPAPYGAHLHIGDLSLSTAADPDAVRGALLDHLQGMAADTTTEHLTVTLSGSADPRAAFYTGRGFAPLTQVQRYTLSARTGQVFYKVGAHHSSGPAQIEGWHMPIGRVESARQHWEALFPAHWTVIPQVAAQRVDRLALSVSGQEAFVVCTQGAYDPRSAALAVWTLKPLTKQVLSAVRDWAHRESYRSLSLIVDAPTAKLLGPDAEAEAYTRAVYALRL